MAEAAGKIARGELMTPAIELTHEQLRKRAIQWLTNTRHCGVVLSEISCLCSRSRTEIPDLEAIPLCRGHHTQQHPGHSGMVGKNLA